MSLVGAVLLLGSIPAEHRFDREIEWAVVATTHIFPVPANLVRAVIKQESAFRPDALSKCGARGLMQVMPFNAAKLGLSHANDLWEPRWNILAGVRLLAALLKHYDGDVIATLVAYNSGPKAKLSSVPSNGETPEYVLRVLAYWRVFSSDKRR